MENYDRKGVVSRFMALGLFFVMALGSSGALQAATLSAAATEDLVFMREEEKLARDVYLTLYDKWNMRIFKTISTSEQNHMDAVKVLLDRYGIPDPVAGNGVGVFTDQGLQESYDDFVDQGLVSLLDAMMVGAAIENADIESLNAALAVPGLPADVQRVYGNLLKASNNHLDAFNYQLDRL